ncbi:MAG: DsbA family oxidoreductase [Rhodothermales bacterium]|nr:DsbA family oxidoreductase [Rhodothermales bacterium]MCA0268811.1 DsbA family oxidoreductase [Bacteroidota bacterium]
MTRLDLFADLVCPWCYLAEVRLDRVLREAGRDASNTVRYWQPFLLDPTIPEDGEPWETFVVRKFGSAARAEAMFRAVEDAGREEGIAFDFSRMTVSPNTRKAHRLVLAADGRGFDLARRFFRAHFEQHANLSDDATLAQIAAEEGVDASTVLNGDAYDADVDVALEAAAHLGITGVPLVVFDRRFAVSGAQPDDVFQTALDKALRSADSL